MQQDVQQSISDQHWFVHCEPNAPSIVIEPKLYDTAFIRQNHWLEQPPVDYAEQAMRNLLGRIARNKKDIYSMVKRIYLLSAIDDKTRLAGAVFDLFYCLEDKGETLRKRILQSVITKLPAETISFLTGSNTLSNINDANTPDSIKRYSLLYPGLWGTTDIIDKAVANNHAESALTPLQEARDYINQGDITAAATILEKALLTTPHDQTISDELYLVYTYTRSSSAIEEMLHRLEGVSIDYKSKWQALIQQIKQERRIND